MKTEKSKSELIILNQILNSTLNGVVGTDENGKINYYNGRALTILGIEEKMIENQNFTEMFDDFNIYTKALAENYKITKKKVYYKEEILVIDFIPYAIDKKVAGATVIIQDISSYEKIVDELNVSKELITRLDLIFEYSYDGIFITDGKANTLRINRAYERITGLNRSDLIGKNMNDIVKSGVISESGSLRVIEEKETISINQKFSTGKRALITSKPVFDSKGEIVLIVTNVRDITELYDLRSQLSKQERLTKKYLEELKKIKKSGVEESEFIVEDEKMVELLQSCVKVAATDIPVLLLGESGVGKEEVAKFIHKNSNRSEGNFVKINCGAIPENLMESEFFGYEGGAFSGASKDGKKGIFEEAHNGTLFLDELGEFPISMQVKILRVLQEGEIMHVGGTKVKKVDVRIVSATNRNLEDMVENKTFRKDLFYRLNVVPVKIPPLRERPADTTSLIIEFLRRYNKKYNWNKYFDNDALDALSGYDWPGNIRELKNIIARSMAISPNDVITKDDLPKLIVDSSEKISFLDTIVPLKEAVAEVEKKLIDISFRKHGNVRDAAKALGIDASTFVRKRKKYEN